MIMQKKAFYLNTKHYILDICFTLAGVILFLGFLLGTVVMHCIKNGDSFFKITPFIIVVTCVASGFILAYKEKIHLLRRALKNRTMPWILLDGAGIHYKSACIAWSDIAIIDFCDGEFSGKKRHPRIYIYHDNQVTVISEYLDISLLDLTLLADAYLKRHRA